MSHQKPIVEPNPQQGWNPAMLDMLAVMFWNVDFVSAF